MKTKFMRSEEGSALIITMILVLMVLGLVMGMSTATMSEVRDVDDSADALHALQIAEAGLGAALVRLNAGALPAADGAWFTLNIDGGTADISTSVKGSDFVLQSVGTFGRALEGIETIGKEIPPLEAIKAALTPTGAIGMVGDLTKKTKLKIPGNAVPLEPGEIPDPVEGKDNPILISGIDLAGVDDPLPGVAIEGTEAFTAVMDKISKSILDGKIDPAIFQGPLTTYYNEKKKASVEVSIAQTAPPAAMDADLFADLADKIAAAIQADLIPTATFIDDKTFAPDVSKGKKEK